MKLSRLALSVGLMLLFSGVSNAQTMVQFESGFITNDDGGIAYLANTGNLAIIDQQGGGGGGATRLDIYTTTGMFLNSVTLSTAGLAAGEEFLDNGLADMPNGNVIVVTTLGNIFEVNPLTGAIVPGGYGGFNVLSAMPPGAETAGFAFDPSTRDLWMIDDNGNPFDTLTQFSSTGAVLSGPIFALPGNLNGDAEAVSFTPGLQTMFVAEDDTNSLIEITPAGTLVQTLSVTDLSQGSGLFVDPTGIAMDFENKRMFVCNKGDDFGNVMVFSILDEQPLLGDVNGDGVVNLLDVDPFVDLLISGGYQETADMNQDGVVNLADVNPFVNAISG